ncbi:PP2C family protein-serine/threonine phosphatase [Nonomuraea wenchangensis]|uniref:PP2C family protein-serine/threonine phosphatase n=1 Tax=Nonomuraea wenchangensis TaxID=568860 RepID=UPI00341224FC
MIVIITAADLLSPSTVRFGALLVAAPAITASFAGAWFTGLIGLLAVGAEMIIGFHHHLMGSGNERAELIAMILVSAFVVLFCLIRDRERRVLVQVRSVAEAAQRALLRPLPESLGSLRLASVYLAAAAEARIGGDLYAAVRTEGATRLIIGDARGKGLPAISDAAALVGAFREATRRGLSLPELAADLEDSAGFNPYESAGTWQADDESFVTAVALDIADDEPVLTMVNCGHPPPLLVHAGKVTPLECERPAPPLGLGHLGDEGYSVCSFRFDEGDLLLLYTDGVTEARDTAGVFYPLADRIAAWTEEFPDGLLKRVCADLTVYTGGRLGDDAAMIAIRRLPLHAAPEPPGASSVTDLEKPVGAANRLVQPASMATRWRH